LIGRVRTQDEGSGASYDADLPDVISRHVKNTVIAFVARNFIQNFVSNHATAVRARASKVPFPSFVNMHVSTRGILPPNVLITSVLTFFF
jgi:hypothetical protein